MPSEHIMIASLCVTSSAALAGWFSAWNSRRQARLSEANLRSDFRDKIVDVHNRVTDFHRALVIWDGSESTKPAQDGFIRAVGSLAFYSPTIRGSARFFWR